MGWIADAFDSLRSLDIRQALTQLVNLVWGKARGVSRSLRLTCFSAVPGMVVALAVMAWKCLICVTGTESPVVVVLSGSMEPGFQRLHERQDTREISILTKGDNNDENDRVLYAKGHLWLQKQHIMGRAIGFLPYVGWITIVLTEIPVIKYLLIGALGLFALTSKE
ncbi:hypothetical protein ZIOFF_056643 [Zingiber officinale]|uniref:Uncharacterized protein n=1 Tax=Zingiber officinale TaxID=94328 RepID=A0A8J5FI75_ZINOF|nr:hypothetical protein ZIOFF_056643 [Zingiber officinale]